MKKALMRTAAIIVIAIIGIYVFRGPLFNVLEGAITADMFVPGDTDSFDPGLPVHAQFPAIRALYHGQEITAVDQFMRDKGAIFIANRSVDW
jgi:hypothetical protein